jgi:hypothetical protein
MAVVNHLQPHLEANKLIEHSYNYFVGTGSISFAG